MSDPQVLRAAAISAAADGGGAGSAAFIEALQSYQSALAALPPLWSDLTPALLTPVRLEIRYLTSDDAAASPILAIRVIPDDVAHYTFEPGLTAPEHAAGSAYWAAVGGGADPTAAWNQVQTLLGNARGAWAVEVTRPDSTVTDPGTRTTTQPASSLILPDHFTFRGWREQQLIFEQDGEPVPPDLCLGPDFNQLSAASAPADPTDRLPWTSASKWMVDLDKAVNVGLAVKVPLTGTNLAFDVITVVGASSATSADGADRLARTLQGHLYTSGLGFPPAGSPTNNTDATRSEWSSAPAMRSPDEVSADIAAAGPGLGQPGVTVADAFGMAADVRPGVPGRRDLLATPQATTPGDDNLTQRAHALIANYYQNLTSPGWLTSDALSAHFTAHVRAGGPLPVLRVGRQPYGLLPVTDLLSWMPTVTPDIPDSLTSILLWWRAQLDAQLGSSPRLSGDPDQDQDPVLLGLLQREPTPVQLRAANGDRTVYSERQPSDIPSMSDPFDLTPSQPPGPSSPPPPWPLAAMTATAAQLPSFLAAANAGWCTASTDLDHNCHNNGLYWAVQAYAVLHWRAVWAASEGGSTDWTDLNTTLEKALAPLRALEADAASDWAAVDTHLAAAVTALGPRADSWATSVATARLRALRTTATTGIHLGMYGWLVDVEPLSTEARSADQGWALTPSPQHAVTAAVLFAGAQAHESTAFDIDLTSERVRRAQQLLAGIRDGSTLEELLGYQLERELHDNHLDVAIADLRTAYPLPVIPVTAPAPDPARTARIVVDGNAVRLHFDQATQIIEAAASKADIAAPPATVTAILHKLDDTVDATGDVLLAEAVHHLVGGSPLRAGLTVDALGKGTPPPSQLDAISTPTAALTVSHTVALAVAIPDPADSWPTTGARATLDPAAEALASWTLGGPDDWCIDVAAPNYPVTTLTPTELGVSALDFVAEVSEPIDSCALAARARAQLADPANSTVTVRRVDGQGGTQAAALLASTVRTVLARCRPLADPAMALDPGSASAGATDLDGLAARITTWLGQVQHELQQAAADTDGDAATATLSDLARLGLQGARFDSAPSTLSQLAAQWGATSNPITAPAAGASAADASAWLTRATSTLRPAIGDWFTAAAALNPDNIALPGDQPASGADDNAITDWLFSHTPVCAGVAALADLLTISGAFGGGVTPQWIVRQYVPTATTPGPWIGATHPGIGSGTSLTALHIGDSTRNPQLWVTVDQWDETLPPRFATDPQDDDSTNDPQQDAAVSMRFDSPDSRAPQALLLVVPPAPQRGWCLEDLHTAVEETLWWSMARPLDVDDLPDFGVAGMGMY